MVKAKILLGLNVCLLSFYISALRANSEVSEIRCAKLIWYSLVLNTFLDLICALNRIGAIMLLGNHETTLKTIFFWHKNKRIATVFLLCQLVEFISKGMLFNDVVSIKPYCKETIMAHGIIWVAAELQAYIFIIAAGVLGITLVFFLNAMLVVEVFGWNLNHLWDVENPEPIPVHHGIEMTEGGESKSRKPTVRRTEDEEKACSICLENEKTHACIPCGHLCLCALCAEDLSKKGVKGQDNTKCPICRLEAANFSRIYQ